jgi:hypothetical protein
MTEWGLVAIYDWGVLYLNGSGFQFWLAVGITGFQSALYMSLLFAAFNVLFSSAG